MIIDRILNKCRNYKSYKYIKIIIVSLTAI